MAIITDCVVNFLHLFYWGGAKRSQNWFFYIYFYFFAHSFVFSRIFCILLFSLKFLFFLFFSGTGHITNNINNGMLVCFLFTHSLSEWECECVTFIKYRNSRAPPATSNQQRPCQVHEQNQFVFYTYNHWWKWMRMRMWILSVCVMCVSMRFWFAC